MKEIAKDVFKTAEEKGFNRQRKGRNLILPSCTWVRVQNQTLDYKVL